MARPLLEGNTMKHFHPQPPAAEPMVDARQAASLLNLPAYYFTKPRCRASKRIPHYRVAGWFVSACRSSSHGQPRWEALMSDYRVRISVRNARLLCAIEQAGHRPGLSSPMQLASATAGRCCPTSISRAHR